MTANGVSSYPYDEDISMIKKQMELELDVREAGAVRYQKQLDKMATQGKLDNSSFAARIIAEKIDPVAAEIEAWLQKDRSRKAGAHNLAAPFLEVADHRVCAMLGLKAVMARIFGETPTVTSIVIAIGKAVEEECRLTALRKADREAYNGVMKAAASKNRSKSRTRTANYLADRSEGNLGWTEWSDVVRAHVGMVILTAINDATGMFRFETITFKQRKSNVVVPTEDTRTWINNNINFMQFMKPQLEPMVVKPRPWNAGELDGGFLTSHVPFQPFVKTRNKRYLEELKYADMPKVHSALNAAQNTKWRINPEVRRLISDMMNTNLNVAGIPRKDYLSIPPKPYDIATNDEARRLWANNARETHEENTRIMSKKIAITSVLKTAKKYEDIGHFYCPANCDFRARVYYLTQLSPQGPDYIKAMMEFAEGKRIGEQGIPWLKYHIANLFGIDKVSQEDRIAWVDEHTEELLRGVHTPFGDNILWHTADDPLQAYAASLELLGVVRNGPDHITRIPIHLDGSCSGIQHLSMAFRCEKSGATVNLVPSDIPADLYGIVAEKSVARLKELAEDPKVGHLARWWLDFGVTRKTCKRNCMTYAYSSKQRGMADQILVDTLKPAKREGNLTLPEGVLSMHLSSFLANINYDAIQETAQKAGEAMEWMAKAARIVAKRNLPISWHTPLGFPVVQAYRNFKPVRVETNLNGKRVTMSLQEEQLTIDTSKSAAAIAPNFVHSMDATHLQLVAHTAKEEGITDIALIHDSFGTYACDTPRFYGIIRETFVKMYETPVFENFKAELEAQLGDDIKLPDLPTTGTLDPEDILESKYCFA